MTTKAIWSLALLGLAGAAAGCAGGASPSEVAAAEPLEVQAARVAARDPIEAFRLLRKGVENDDVRCAFRLLAFAERQESTRSQRTYARLFLEKQLAAGGLRDQAAELRYRLALSWNFVEPRNLARVRTHLEALARLGVTDAMANSALLREMALLTGVQMSPRGRSGADEPVLACDASSADGGAVMGQRVAPDLDDGAPATPAEAMGATVWGGGNDKLLDATGVLAFLVNDRGEPSFHGRNLWIRNASGRTVLYSVPGADVLLRELPPGEEERVALDARTTDTTGIEVTVRFASLR